MRDRNFSMDLHKRHIRPVDHIAVTDSVQIVLDRDQAFFNPLVDDPVALFGQFPISKNLGNPIQEILA